MGFRGAQRLSRPTAVRCSGRSWNGGLVAGLGMGLSADERRRRNRGLTMGRRDWTDGRNWIGCGGRAISKQKQTRGCDAHGNDRL
jgi:hypothetical protein